MVAVGVAVGWSENFEGDARQIFGGGYALQNDRLVIGQGVQKSDDLRVAPPDQEGMVPRLHDEAHGDFLDLGEVHDHAIVGLAGRLDDLARQRYFESVAMAVQMATLALVVGDTVPGIEFQATGNQHGGSGNLAESQYSPALLSPSAMPALQPVATGLLSVADHSRDVGGMTYVYPVVSRRAGGVSVGINLNPNRACNWRCIYCQVPDLKRGGPPPIDLERLEGELRELLQSLYWGDFLTRHVPPEARRVVDIAFSGDGEPTSAAEFPAAVGCVGAILDELALAAPPRLRLITNGSLLDRRYVREGIAALGVRGGETWFKVDAVAPIPMRRINNVAYQPASVLRRLRLCASLCETWVQTCVFALDGTIPWLANAEEYLELLRQTGKTLAGVHLYGVARSSRQPEATRLQNPSAAQMAEIAARVEKESGLTVRVSP